MRNGIGLARLLVGTALAVPGAFATGAAAQQAPGSCGDLVALVERGLPDALADTLPDILVIAEAGDADRCTRVLGDLETAMQDGVTEEERQALQLVETDRTVVRLQDEAVIEGRVYVDSTPPEVAVEEGETEVVVSGGEPQVTVREQPAEILVRQPPATIRFEMPRPVITIDQPAPEIIITMPEPGVEVANSRPQVEVRQAEPRVRVTQAAPRVDLELQRAEDPDASQGVQVADRATGEAIQPGQARETEANVQVTRSEPRVTFEQSAEGGAQVNVERAEPQVRFEQAEPQVEVTEAGEPEIRYTQSGEPRITFAEAGSSEGTPPAQALDGAQIDREPQARETETEASADAAAATPPAQPLEGGEIDRTAQATTEAETAQPADPAATTGEGVQGAVPIEAGEIEIAEGATTEAPEGTATEGADARPVAPLWTGPAIEREGYSMVEAGAFDGTELEGATVYGLEDESIGDIGEVILTQAGQVEGVVIDVGGFLGLGERPVLVSFDQLTIMQQANDPDDVRVYIDSTQERLEALPAYEG